MDSEYNEISVRGKIIAIPSIKINDYNIVIKGRIVKIGEIFDLYWIEKSRIPNLIKILEELKKSPRKPDIFSFVQRVPDTEPQYSFHTEWENYAVIILDSYEHWINKQIDSSSRRNIKASSKRGVEVRICQFDDDYVRGIMAIYNESPIRQGRRFWHYGKDFASVKAENGTYKDRSLYLGAYYEGEMIGYLKIVLDENAAAIMQILSKIMFYDKRPNDALLAKSVQECCSRGIKYLKYEKFIYGKKADNTLTRFKASHGFVRMDVPRYYIPLTNKGLLVLRLGFHKKIKERLPEWVGAPLRAIRTKWYERQIVK